ncbi:hypothetical protein ACFCV3_41740 [Kribbella sp. NPDC056345]|uniref:hypothetical protein n=1 Tax=Kribbella sp. NPDC056345 TaxID=3345789 RepID=UPI0035D5D9CB
MSTHVEGAQVRITVDLDAELHRDMKQWRMHQGRGVTLAKIYRALSNELLSDPELARSVLSRIHA